MSILCAIDVRLLDKEVYTNQNMKGADWPFGLYLRQETSIAAATSRAEAINEEILENMTLPDLDIGIDFSTLSDSLTGG